MELVWVVTAAFAAAALAPWSYRLLPKATPWVLAAAPAGAFLLLLSLRHEIAAGHAATYTHAWLPQLGIDFALRMDGLGFLFALLVTGVGALVTLYAGSYLRGDPMQGRFFLYLFLFMGAMLGVVLADDFITFFVFWELTSLSSYFLIGYFTEQEGSRRRALQALLVTGGGGLALLAGLVLLGIATDTSTFSAVNAQGLADSPLATGVLVLVLLGAFTKSAQFPFHFWLPGAMVAPSPVSAYLHSATMVKAGIYLMARLHPTLSPLPQWTPWVATIGFVTLALGTFLSLRQTDLKLILAYTTVASLGLMTFLLGIGSTHAVEAAIVFLAGHALYKGALFLVAGIVDHETGTRDIRRLGALRRSMPWTTGAALLAGLSFMGLPPLFGFIGKESTFNAILEGPSGPVLLGMLAVLFVGSIVAAGLVAIGPFWIRSRSVQGHEAGPMLLAGPIVLAAAGFLFGLVPRIVDESIISPAASAVLATPVHLHLALWHGWNIALVVSGLVVAAGFLLLLRADALRSVLERVSRPFGTLGPQRGYDAFLGGLVRFAKAQARVWQHGYLRGYLMTIFGVMTLAVAAALARMGGPGIAGIQWQATPFEAVLAFLICAAAIAVAVLPSRLGAVAVLGVVGYGVALVFILFGAPDLAMTQFLFETLSVLIFVLVLWGMPKLTLRSPSTGRLRDAGIAAAAGLTMTVLVLAATTHRFSQPISEFYRAASYVEAHGRNVVNVILVDFRGLDTLGEITVLAVAALGVAALLRLRQGGPA